MRKFTALLFVIFMVILGITLKQNHEFSGVFSDARLKTDVSFMRKSPSGINIYSYSYIGDPTTRYQGVMAQELIGTPFEDALIRGEKYFMVDYSKIDVEFKEIPSAVRQ